MNAIEMNRIAERCAKSFETVPESRREIVRQVIENYCDPALAIAVRTKIKSEAERKRFDALMLLEGVQ